MHVTEYLDERIREFEEKLNLITTCRAREMDKPCDNRNYNMLYMFHKDEALYRFCLSEFNLLKTMLHEA